MKFFPVIRYHDKSIRVITHAQSDAIQKAYDKNMRYIKLDGDIIALSSISRIESARFLCAETVDNFSPFGFPSVSESACRTMCLLPISDYHLDLQIKEVNCIIKRLQSQKNEKNKESVEEKITKLKDYLAYLAPLTPLKISNAK